MIGRMRSLDSSSDDFRVAPWDYPGTPAPFSGLVHRDGLIPLRQGRRRLGQALVSLADEDPARLNVVLLKSNAAPVDTRSLVVAVGSNASPAVLRRKFSGRGVSTTFPLLRVRVRDISVGFSAHVSAAGYIANTPYHRPGARTALVASLLDPSQLACLDRTEPNYRRIWVEAPDWPVKIRKAERLAGYYLYVSRWDLLGPGEPLSAPMTQDEVWRRVVEGIPHVQALIADPTDPRAVMRACAVDPSLRALDPGFPRRPVGHRRGPVDHVRGPGCPIRRHGGFLGSCQG